jgi:hypothetical protein
MYPNQPGGPPPNPDDPTNPSAYPQQPEQPGQYPPPAYNQAPPPQYPQQPQQPLYPQQPQYAQQAPQQPKKSSKKGWIIGCSIAALVVLLACGGIGVALYIGAQKAADAVQSGASAVTAAAQVTLYCTDIEEQQYGSAYQLLSKSAQGSHTQQEYTTLMQSLDTNAGQVATCNMDPNHTLPSINGNTATAQVQVARGDNANLATGSVKLVLEDNQWKIDSADSSLKLF